MAFTVLLAWGSFAYARQKTYQTTKLLDLEAGPEDFCVVVQVDDIAYRAVAHARPRKMIIGDPIQIRIKNDDLFIKTVPQWSYDDYEIKAPIRIRQRMASGTKLPSCALAVTVH